MRKQFRMAEQPMETMPVTQEEEVGIELGDKIVIFGGRYNKTVGTLYGIQTDRFTIQPLGTTSTVLHIPLVDGEPDPQLGIQEIQILKKAVKPGFVFLTDMHPGLLAEMFTANGEPAGTFKVESVDEEKDSAVFLTEAGDRFELLFGFTGIPRDESYEVIRTRQPPATEEEGNNNFAVTGDQVEQKPKDTEGIDIADGAVIGDFVIGEEIEIPLDEEVIELSSSERIYPDIYQRSEMLSELIRALPEVQQKNPVKLQEVRRLVEVLMILRNEVVKYGVTGEPRGIKPTSLTTLSELILNDDMPLAKKVATLRREIYLDHSKQHLRKETVDSNILIHPEFVKFFLSDFLKSEEQLRKRLESSLTENLVTQGLPTFFMNMEEYRRQIQTPYQFDSGKRVVKADEDIFVNEIPDLDTEPAQVLTGPFRLIAEPSFKQAGFKMSRALKNRQVRFLEGEPNRIVEPGEAPAYDNVLVFPRTALREFGPIRSGSLAQDMSLGMSAPELITDLLDTLGEVSAFPTAEGILNIGLDGISGITLSDWLNELNLIVNGLGDVYSLLQGYGVKNLEFNSEQLAVLQKKVEEHLAALKIFMTKQREENAVNLSNLKYEPQDLLSPEDSTRLLDTIQTEGILQKAYEDLQDYMGDLSKVDTNWFSYLLLQFPDLLLTVLGKQGDLIAKERLKSVRDKYLEAQLNGYRIIVKQKESARPTRINTCEHVAELETIRKVVEKIGDEPQDYTKMKALKKFLDKYRGETKENWVYCFKCNEHLLCAHEVLQIQEFLRPKEKDNIHKELLIKFSGGQFSGKFICRVCGQGISNLDFDTNIEFDDEGRPMMGRSVMEDTDAIKEQEIEDLLSGPAQTQPEYDFGSPEKNTMYRCFRLMANNAGINPEKDDYEKMLNTLSSYLAKLPDKNKYEALVKASQKGAPEYQKYYAINYTAAAAATLLLNIQTRIPEYVIYYTNADCAKGFYGYPLDESEQKQNGMFCLASIVSSINENAFPWNSNGLQDLNNVTSRREKFLPNLKALVVKFINYTEIRESLEKKRDYLLKLYGTVSDGNKDQIPATFRPVPYLIPEGEAAKEQIVANVASPEHQSAAWIQTAHSLVRKSAALHPDTPFSLTTCCLHSIKKPTEFWDSQNLPALDEQQNSKTNYRSTTARTTFFTIPPVLLEAEVKESEFYQLFVKVCYRGEKKGLPHELGLGLTCFNCQLHFKENPFLPLDGTKDEQMKKIEDLKAHLQNEGIIITKDTFYELLQTVQQRSYANPLEVPTIEKKNDLFRKLSALPFWPFENTWATLLYKFYTNFQDLAEDDKENDIKLAEAASDIYTELEAKENFLKAKLKVAFPTIERIVKQSPREMGEIIKTFLLVPFQRWKNGLGQQSSNIIEKLAQQPHFRILDSYELSDQTKIDIMNSGLGNHLAPIGDKEDYRGLAKIKSDYFIQELSCYCKEVFPFLRASETPGGMIIVKLLLRCYVMGSLYKLANSQIIPSTEEDSGTPETSNINKIYYALGAALTKYEKGSYTPSEAEIRIKLEQRAEAEKQKFIKKLDVMSKDRRQVELINKKLGLGDWAIGASKAIRQYDADRYEAERIERAQAGLTDYAMEGPPKDGRAMDMFGFMSGEINEADAGNDVEQMREDDY